MLVLPSPHIRMWKKSPSLVKFSKVSVLLFLCVKTTVELIFVYEIDQAQQPLARESWGPVLQMLGMCRWSLGARVPLWYRTHTHIQRDRQNNTHTRTHTHTHTHTRTHAHTQIHAWGRVLQILGMCCWSSGARVVRGGYD